MQSGIVLAVFFVVCKDALTVVLGVVDVENTGEDEEGDLSDCVSICSWLMLWWGRSRGTVKENIKVRTIPTPNTTPTKIALVAFVSWIAAAMPPAAASAFPLSWLPRTSAARCGSAR